MTLNSSNPINLSSSSSSSSSTFLINNHNIHIIHNNNNNNNININIPTTPTATVKGNGNSQACAACKYQRRKCAADCILAPYFPHDSQRQFLNAHRLFGVSNITKIIKNLDPAAKDEAMRTIIFQSDARASDPVGGCFRIVRDLQRQIDFAKAEYDAVTHHLSLFRSAAAAAAAAAASSSGMYAAAGDLTASDCHFLEPVQQTENDHYDVSSWVLQDNSSALDLKQDDVKPFIHRRDDEEDDDVVLKDESFTVQQDHDLRDAATLFSLNA